MIRQFVFMMALIASGAGSICAQVIVGATGNDTFHEGAIMELRADGESGGLLMPKVMLVAATDWTPMEGTPINGMMVYNLNYVPQNELAGKGIYVWTDGRWHPYSAVSAPCSSAPPAPILKTNGLAGDQVKAFEPFVVYVANPTPGASYEWTLPIGLAGHSTSDVISIVGSNAGAYTVRVRAKNECGVSGETSCPVTVFTLPSGKDESGNIFIQGVSCYDIAKTDRGSACGALSSRRPAFPDANSRRRTYTISVQNRSGLSNLRVGWMDDIDNIIQSVSISGNTAGSLAANAYTLTVIFSADVNDIVKNKADYTSTAKLFALYRSGSVDKYTTLTVTVQDCSCCPLNVAKIVPNAAYEGADVITLGNTIASTLAHFRQIPRAALCVWKTNQGNTVSANVGNNWMDGNIRCTRSLAASRYGDDWRLPNVAEMYYRLHYLFLNDGGQSSSSYKGTSRYLSNTASRSDRNNIFYTTMSDASTVKIYGTSVSRTTMTTANYRCVKTISY
jgi:hypothetical protein